ncbi:MAG TPA: cytochrome P450 [Allosphingosinicella sp.]|nr:cytochrome P450 [Allosphingosinicella sp.]
MKMHEVRSFALASAVLRRPDMRQALYDQAGKLLGRAVINLHGAEHRARRSEELKVFRKDFFQYYEREVLRPELATTLAPYVRAGSADLIDLGYRLMLDLTADFAGIDRPGRTPEATEDLLRLLKIFALAPVLDQSTLADIGSLKAELGQGIADFERNYLTPSADRREAIVDSVRRGEAPESALPRDVLTVLVQAQEKLGMSRADLLQESIFFLLAGAHTSVHALAHVMAELFGWLERHPEDRALVDHDPLFIQRCVHEALRLYPSSPIAKRRPDCPMRVEPLGELDEDDVLLLNLVEANRDPAAFGDDARSFDPHRRTPPGASPFGLSMGMGAHVCLGLQLATGAVPKPGIDPATHHVGTVAAIVRALFSAGVAPDPRAPPVSDSTTTRVSWARFPIIFAATG